MEYTIKMNNMDKDSSVIKLIKSAYEKSGKTHTQIAEDIKSSQAIISRLFNGKQYASLSMLVKIGLSVGLTSKQVALAYKKDKITQIDAEIAEFI